MNGMRVKSRVLIHLVLAVLLAGCWRPAPVWVHTGPSDVALGARSHKTVYIVKKGDTAYRIARCHGVELRTLVALNKISAPYLIRIGQRIRLPRSNMMSSCLVNRPSQSEQLEAGSADSKIKNASVSLVVSPPALPANKTVPLSKPPLRAGAKFLWPVRGKLVSKFGPKPGNLRNDGINISAPVGSPVRAAENGVVAYVGNELRGYGNMLLVRHDGGWVTAYAHNSELLVERGAVVVRGEVIARVGQSGNVDKPQTHFELRRGDEAVDPYAYLSWQ